MGKPWVLRKTWRALISFPDDPSVSVRVNVAVGGVLVETDGLPVVVEGTVVVQVAQD